MTVESGLHTAPPAADLEAADAVLITASTRDILRVAEVEGVRIRRVGDVPERLLAAFRAYVAGYCAERQAQPVR